jgi:hypothetical protein
MPGADNGGHSGRVSPVLSGVFRAAGLAGERIAGAAAMRRVPERRVQLAH